MNRFFRSALFPLVIIAALVWLALQTLGTHSSKTVSHSTYDFIKQVQTAPNSIQDVSIDPNKQSITATVSGTKWSLHYASPQSEATIEKYMTTQGVDFNSKGVGTSPWWSIARGWRSR